MFPKDFMVLTRNSLNQTHVQQLYKSFNYYKGQVKKITQSNFQTRKNNNVFSKRKYNSVKL